jgi:hypothetical protein
MNRHNRLRRIELHITPTATRTHTIAPAPHEVEALTAPNAPCGERAAVLARYGFPADARTFGPIVTESGPVVCVQTGSRSRTRVRMGHQTIDL